MKVRVEISGINNNIFSLQGSFPAPLNSISFATGQNVSSLVVVIVPAVRVKRPSTARHVSSATLRKMGMQYSSPPMHIHFPNHLPPRGRAISVKVFSPRYAEMTSFFGILGAKKIRLVGESQRATFVFVFSSRHFLHPSRTKILTGKERGGFFLAPRQQRSKGSRNVLSEGEPSPPPCKALSSCCYMSGRSSELRYSQSNNQHFSNACCYKAAITKLRKEKQQA